MRISSSGPPAAMLTLSRRLIAARLNRCLRTASAILGSEADAHDVVQEAFVAAWRHLPRLRDRTKFDAWLNRTIVNRCRDALRRRRRSREVALDVALDHPGADSAGAADDMAALASAFERLGVDHRHLLVMHHLHRVPVADLSQGARDPRRNDEVAAACCASGAHARAGGGPMSRSH